MLFLLNSNRLRKKENNKNLCLVFLKVGLQSHSYDV